MKVVTPSSLCENCQEFRIERLFGLTEPKDNDPYHARLIPGGCGLCEFFMECLPERCRVRSADGKWSICLNSASSPDARDSAYGSTWCDPRVKQDGWSGVLWIVVSSEKGLLEDVRVSPFVCIDNGRLPTYALEASPSRLDLAPISEWLKTETHTGQAQQYRGVASANLVLTVIDCNTRRLVPLLDEERYATLSYVWGPPGQPSLDNANGNRLPLHLPNTIQDSIDVCNELGIRYLWVDRYCISHESGYLRSLQISRMDEVYQNSFLTIVACAGADPNFGLPGISRPRDPNPCIEVVGLGCIRGLSHSIEIHHGIWATRAWTYQEALLSQRQLYFTNKEVFCGSAKGTQEIGSLSRSSLEQVFQHLLNRFSLSNFTRDEYSIKRLDVWECIREYSTRALSYQSDILNALLGILAYYRREHGICHLWGIPFTDSVPARAPSTFLRFELSLRWIVIGPSSRREGFPSWSWTGCYGRVQHLGINQGIWSNVATMKEEGIKIEVELTSGRLVEWPDYQADYANMEDYGGAQSPNESPNQPSRFIHLEAFTSRIIAKHNAAIDYYAIDASTIAPGIIDYFGSVESQSCTESHAKIEESLPIGSLLALHLPKLDSSSFRGGVDSGAHPSFLNDGCALLIRNFGDHWERVCLLGSCGGLRREEVHKVRRKIRLG